jgi:hypothetical protein
MNVNQMLVELRRLQKEGFGKTECLMFPNDNCSERLDSGDGPVFSIDNVTRVDGSVIVAIRA